jgi:hypothetical protein
MCDLLVRAFHYTIFKTWYYLKKLLEYPMFPAFPEHTDQLMLEENGST